MEIANRLHSEKPRIVAPHIACTSGLLHFAPFHALPKRRAYCPSQGYGHRPKDTAAAFYCASRIALTTRLLCCAPILFLGRPRIIAPHQATNGERLILISAGAPPVSWRLKLDLGQRLILISAEALRKHNRGSCREPEIETGFGAEADSHKCRGSPAFTLTAVWVKQPRRGSDALRRPPKRAICAGKGERHDSAKQFSRFTCPSDTPKSNVEAPGSARADPT
jgi:hypothetical protein